MKNKQKSWAKLWLLLPLLSLFIILSACGKNIAQEDVMQRVDKTNEVTWGVKSDTRLFGLMNIKTGEIEGFDVDIAKAISKKMFGDDVKVNFVPVTSNTRLPLLKNGNVDGLVSTMTITPERKKEIDFSDVYFNAGQAIIVKKGSKIKSVNDLTKGTKVIGIQGSNSVDNIKKAAPDTRVLQLSDAAQAFTALKSGQGDAMTTDNGILYGLVSDDPNYQVVGGTFTSEPYGIGINKGQKNFRKAINKALKEIQKDGTYQKIVDKWFDKISGFDGSVVK